MDKKKIFAITLFLLMGFFMFTFANPSDNGYEVIGEQTETTIETKDEDITVSDVVNNANNLFNNNTNNGFNPVNPIVIVDNAPVINVTPKTVKIVLGQDYDVFEGVTVEDDNDILVVNASIKDTKSLEAGSYVISYDATDRSGNKSIATRTIIVLDLLGDEDNDGYTNEEELASETDFDNEEETPDYDKAPAIDYSNCDTSMIVFGNVPDFETCVKVTDNFYGEEGVKVDINTDIDSSNVGEYTVTIVATDNLDNTTVEEFVFKVEQAKVTITIDNKTSVYGDDIVTLTSDEKDVTIDDNEIGVTLSTTATKDSEVGSYAITGTYTNKNYDVTFINGTYEITAKELTDSLIEELGISFDDKIVTYNGSEQQVLISGDLLDILEVDYTNNKATNAGTYNATAVITSKDSNYKGSVTLTATLTINKANYDMSNISFADKTITFDGNEHKVTITGTLPEGVTVSYTNNKGTSAGTYNATAIFAGDTTNYNAIENMTATLVINAKELSEDDLTGITFDDKSVDYNGENHSIVVTNIDTELYDIIYTYNDEEVNGVKNAGTYNVEAIITSKDSNYKGSVTLTATLTINKANVTIKADDKTSEVYLDLEKLTYSVIGSIYGTDTLSVSYNANINKNVVGTYPIKVSATINDNYNITTQEGSYKIYSDINNNNIDDDNEAKYTVTFISSSNGTLSGTTTYANILTGLTFEEAGIVIPTPIANTNFTFANWSSEISNSTVVNSNVTYKALYTANQIGIKVVEKPNVQFQFQKNSTPDFSSLITVYAVYADGKEIEVTDYTTDVDTKEVVTSKTLTITENGFNNTDIIYSVINEEAFQTKFEIVYTGNRYYYETKSDYCTSNCDKNNKVRKVNTNETFLEIIEHYDENIEIKNVNVKYTNGKNMTLSLSDSVRWTHATHSAIYNPVYIASIPKTCTGGLFNKKCEYYDVMTSENVIDTVEVTYYRQGFGTYIVKFNYNKNTNTFTSYDEIKIG